jgi:DNA topoisomerase-2
MDIATKYQKKTPKQHVLDNPDTYIGAVGAREENHYVVVRDAEFARMALKVVPNVPALLNLFGEVLVNCRDHSVRELKRPVTKIEVDIVDGVVSVTNDGDGIDVAVHPEHGVYVPQLIFGELLTSTNYDPDEKKIVGGKNGFGVKLVIIWSEYATIETVDAERQLKYTQNFSRNLEVVDPPTIKACTKKPYTKITFKPDYARLGLPGLDEGCIQLFEKRVFDLAATTHKSVKVYFNKVLVPVKSFLQYAGLYGEGLVHEVADRWEYAVSLADEAPVVQAFVNGLVTSAGGTHVDYITNQIASKVAALLMAKNKRDDVKPRVVKDHLNLFLSCVIENPSFNSQTKERLNTPAAAFGSVCKVSDKFVEKVAALVSKAVLAVTQLKEVAAVKKSDGAKTRSVRGIPKLVDANFAGTAKAARCTLILCEGDSAKAGVVSGLSKADRDVYGVYPMRGKLLNVRDETAMKINENKEIYELKQILGLEAGKDYTNVDKLRYGTVLIMTDQDKDGSHIKGLILNLFDSQWPGLARLPKFLGYMNTPIIKAKKGARELQFYDDLQYAAWKGQEDTRGWAVKYYKGLGTSTAAEFKEYFKVKKTVMFQWDGGDSVDLAFNKKRADHRKTWLEAYRGDPVGSEAALTTTDFVNKELIVFSLYDNERNIPSVVDGLKPSQRKILFAAFKKRLKTELKVAQFSGYVAENSAYHHGEASLNGTIVGMAQDFMGSNNVNFLLPNGQFGTRLQGGKDSASERYIFTQLNPLARQLFPEDDDAVLAYADDDGVAVEPIYYVPVLPGVLLNGVKGIGTGYSTEVLSYNPAQLKAYLQARLRGEEPAADFLPYYRGFKGTVEAVGGKYVVRGVFAVDGLTVRITELPVGVWTDDYKEYLEKMVGTVVKDYTDNSTDVVVDITVKLLAPLEDVEKTLKLAVSKGTTNMHLFDENGRIKKYGSVAEILDAYYPVRLKCYAARKLAQCAQLAAKLKVVSNKVKYVRGVLNDTIDLRGKKAAEIAGLLQSLELAEVEGSFNYLTKMPMDSVSHENVAALEKDKTGMEGELAALELLTPEQMWLADLDRIEV